MCNYVPLRSARAKPGHVLAVLEHPMDQGKVGTIIYCTTTSCRVACVVCPRPWHQPPCGYVRAVWFSFSPVLQSVQCISGPLQARTQSLEATVYTRTI